MEFRRDIYGRLLRWKGDGSGKVLELFDQDFADTEDTITVIDEIQESSRVYNLIRTFARDFDCYVAVTGSYLGRLLDKEFFLPAGDIEPITLETLTFAEFTDVFGKRDLYESIDLYGAADAATYEELRECFALYERIGGYPSVVNLYLEHKDFTRCDAELGRLMDIFTNESKRYFHNIPETNTFEKLFHEIASMLIREKQGVKDLAEDLSEIVYRQESARFYFLDIGIARYFITRAGANDAVVRGLLAENFVFLALRRHIHADIAGSAPWFATYEKTHGELDFFVRSLLDHKNYGIEVKAGANPGKTVGILLADKRIDYAYYLKGDTYGGRSSDGKILTVPLCLADRITFDLGLNPGLNPGLSLGLSP